MMEDTKIMAPAGTLACGTAFESERDKYFKAAGPAPDGEINVMKIHREEYYTPDTPVTLVCKAAEYLVGFEAGTPDRKILRDVPAGWVVRLAEGAGEAVVVTSRTILGKQVCVRLLGGGRFPAGLRVEILGDVADYAE